jgi:hypothetical protein
MAPHKDTTLSTLDAKIEEQERQIAEAKRVARTIPSLLKILQQLRSTRSLLIGESPEPTRVVTPHKRGGKPVPGSIGDQAMAVLRKAPEPVYITDILAQLTSQGIAVEMGSLSGILAEYTRKGWIERVMTGYYRMPHPQPTNLNQWSRSAEISLLK